MNEAPYSQPNVLEPHTQEDRTWAMIVHLSSLSGFIIGVGWIIAPLIIWILKKDDLPFTNQEGKNALNFQITMAIASAISGILVMIFIGIFGLIAIAVMQLIFPIIAGVKASEGKSYTYPMTIRFLS